MINKWILDNFKSIDKEKNLEFRPLTIFTGANSSGKSTVLQSILLLTQTLQNQIHSRSLVLNGSIKRFGSYDDVVYRRDCKKDIKIGFSLKRDPKKRAHHYTPWEEPLKEAECSFVITMDGQTDSLQPVMKRLNLKTVDVRDRQSNLTVSRKEKVTDKERQIIERSDMPNLNLEREYSIETDAKPRIVFGDMPFSQNYIGVGLTHFLPNYVLAYRRTSDLFKRLVSDVVDDAAVLRLMESDSTQLPQGFKDRVIEIANEMLEKDLVKRRSQKFFREELERLRTEFSVQGLLDIFSRVKLDKEQKAFYKKRLIDELNAMSEAYSIERVPISFLFPGVDYMKGYLSNSIRYLGPLREEPRSHYPLESMGSTDVGLKGENTAAVFEINKRKKVRFIDPTWCEQQQTRPEGSQRVTLTEAVNSWLVYLGVAERMETKDLGKIGHELKITTDIKNMRQDLTHVGVGVSQVLPILVMALLAEEDDVIILEQPELHLHPRVQSRLADFFVTMNALGKQCIVETHSEYLINRLRYLVAKSDDRKIADDTLIYFVEKEAGHSVYREITINKYGVIEEWPKGFFDEGERLAASIVRAAMEKKEKEEEDIDYEE